MAVLVSAGIGLIYANQRKLVRLSDGTLYCIYNRSPNGAWQIYVKKSTDNGSTWTDETRISTYAGMSTTTQATPSIAVDASDNLHAVWHGFATGFAKYQIWYVKFNGSTWSEPVRISDKDGMTIDHQRYPSIAVDGSDNLHVVWDGRATGFSYAQIYYSKFVASWSEPVRISDYAGMESYEQIQAGIAIDSNGYLHVAWTGRATGFSYAQVWHAKYTDSWAEPVRVSDGLDALSNVSASIALDSGDDIHVVWTYNNQIYYAKYTDSWSVPLVLSDGVQHHHPSIAIDSADQVHVLWNGKTIPPVDKIWHAKYTDSWAVEVVQDTANELVDPILRWSRYPESNIPTTVVDYLFFDSTASNIYWDGEDNPLPPTGMRGFNPALSLILE